MTDDSTHDAVAHFSGYVEQFQALYEERPDFRERVDIWRELLDRHFVPGGRAVDMGCGTGMFSFYLAQKGGEVVGIDGAPDMIRFCEARRAERGLDNIRFVQARLPMFDEAALADVDLLISSSVVEYVDDLDATFAAFSRVLKRGGVMIISMPNVYCINRIYERVKYRLLGRPEIYRHIRHFSSPSLLARRISRFGFALESARHYTHFTRLAILTRRLGLPPYLTEDLFVAVFRKA